MLTILAISIGHRVSMALYLSQYHKDKLRSLCLAKSAVNLAVMNIQRNNLGQDSLNALLENNVKGASFILLDEERKININTAPKELLVILLEKFQIDNPAKKADNILIWRGDIPDSNNAYEALGYPCKGLKFTNNEELRLVKDIIEEDFRKLKGSITVYGNGPININTASPDVLAMVARSIARQLSVSLNSADTVMTKIISLRDKSGHFKDKEEVKIALTGDEEINIFNKLMEGSVFGSENFLIEATGKADKIKTGLTVVYNRSEKHILYWHES